jgi:hypothetical protein
MKVSIQQTIDTTEIPARLEALVDDLNNIIHEQLVTRFTYAVRLAKTGDKEKTLFALNDLLEVPDTMQVVVRAYEEVVQILRGYHRVLDHLEQVEAEELKAKLAEVEEVASQAKQYYEKSTEEEAPSVSPDAV